MMERFIKRVSDSSYKHQFILKGDMLITSMLGISSRSTMDIDMSIKRHGLNLKDIEKAIKEITSIGEDDGVSFETIQISRIMDTREYPGTRVSLSGHLDKLVVPIKIDISFGDSITPKEIEYEYKTILGHESIEILSYNLETILAEKLQCILSRGVLNTRMRDFYDVYMLFSIYKERINKETLENAFAVTSKVRGTTQNYEIYKKTLEEICKDKDMQCLWNSYKEKYDYAANISFGQIINVIGLLLAEYMDEVE